ncbi:MAG: helix-turn-helix transcriptional regulator [Anaerolineales bacterium]|nr:helix-turn-helix transcriptional regulator [Anaerolineales bacterium]
MSVESAIAQHLNLLFSVIRKENGSEYTHAEVEDATGLTAGYISHLRTGRRDNPTRQTIIKLAQFFGVPPAYFMEPFDPDLSPLTFAFRANKLSPDARQALLIAIDKLLEIEGVEEIDLEENDELQDKGRADTG